jgi:hypothetical protein
MDALAAFGLFAVTAMLVCYALEDRSDWFIWENLHEHPKNSDCG